MSLEKKDGRIVYQGDEARALLLDGAKRVYETIATTYGPKGQNALAEKPFGPPLPTRDGVTVGRETYFSDRAQNMGTQLVLEASEKTNKIAGDGTSATAILSYFLMQNGNQEIAAGTHPMDVKDLLVKDSEMILEKLDKLAKPTKKSQLKEVATVSAGDPLLGQLIAEAIEYVGPDGGITAEKAHTSEVEREYVDGYYLQSGFEAIQQGRKEIVDPTVLVFNRRLSSSAEVLDVLTSTAKAMGLQPGERPKILFIGDIEDAAYATIVNNINQGTIDAIIIKTPAAFGGMAKELLTDIAVYSDCEVINDSTDLKNFGQHLMGSVDRVVATKTETTLFSDNSGETIQDRVKQIKSQLEIDQPDQITEKLKDRIAKLEGKIALFRIGGATDSEKEEKEFRVEDAIQSTRAAYLYGVVAGGGVTLLELSKLPLSRLFRNSLRDTFKQLLLNANLPAELKLDEALKALPGFGYDLRKGDELVDVVKAGILDPKLVVEQIIKNASSVAGTALTTGTLLVFESKPE